jgi:DHA1 family inner membrane transport protein
MSVPLLTLFLAAFAFGTAEFVIAGILPDVAGDVGVSIPVAGYLISGYAIGIAIGGPLLALATNRLSRKTLILWLGGAFTLGQVLCALAASFELLLAARVLVAVVHGAFFGIAPVVGVALVPANRRGFAVALILSGLTVSNILGVPGGTAIGNALGWRATFWAVAGIGLLATLATALFLPFTSSAPAAKGSFKREFRALGRQAILCSLLIVVLVMIGQYGLFTFIAPFLLEVTGLTPSVVPWVLLLFGVGSTIGVFVGGRLADWKLMPSLIGIMVLQAGIYALLYVASPFPWIMAVTVVAWGGVNFAFSSPVQSRVLAWAGDAPNLASALIPTGFNIGIAVGALSGATLLDHGFGYRNLPLIGVAALLAALAIAVLSHIWEQQGPEAPPEAVAAP